MRGKLPAGATLSFGREFAQLGRTYALLEGNAAVEPSQADAAFSDATVYDEPVIALAIEPTPADALRNIMEALGGAGGPSGVVSCEAKDGAAVVEFKAATSAAVVLHLADVELRRFNGYRTVTLLNPLPAETVAKIAASGLQAPQIGPDRILEMLLEQAHVE